MSEAFQMPFVPALDENGDTVPGAQLYFFLAGTTTPEPVYLDEAGGTLAPHPVIANSSGRFPPLWSSGNKYKVVLRKASDIILDEIDNYTFTGVLGSTASSEGEAEEQFLDVDLSDGGTENNELVDAYNAPGVTSTDADYRDFQTTTDQYNYDRAVQPQYYHDQAGSQFAAYHDDIKRFNSLYEQIQSYSAGPVSNNGFVKIRILEGLNKIWGAGRLTGLNAGFSIEGEGVFLSKVGSASFAASPRGADWSRATLQIEASSIALDERIVVGMLYMSGEIMSDATDHSASSATAIVTDDLACLNTAHIIVGISADRRSFEVDVPHVGGDTTQLVGGDIRTTGAGATGFPAGRITIPYSQIAFTGGFDGRADEAWIRPQYGSLVEYADIGFADHTDPTITRSNGFAPDRKNVFAAQIADVLFRQNVGFAGAEGHVLRLAKLVRLAANLSHFGGAGLNTRAGRSAYQQLICWADFTRCSFGNSLTYSLLVSAHSFTTAQNCVSVCGLFGVQAITGSHINFQNSWVYGSQNGLFASGNSTITIDGGTVIENCTFLGQIRDTSKIVENAAPIVIGSGPLADNTTANSTFFDDLIIDKVNGEIIMKHGAAEAFIRNLIGQLHFDVDTIARDLHFGATGVPSIFQMDMSAKKLLINGAAVIGEPGAAIASPAADVNSLQTAVNAILARMRAATPTIQT